MIDGLPLIGEKRENHRNRDQHRLLAKLVHSVLCLLDRLLSDRYLFGCGGSHLPAVGGAYCRMAAMEMATMVYTRMLFA